ncbi:SDR family NAD(P)-dependent oxidoreductase [Aromatoleum petrolei]|uniref:SDR family NAD(P)-dependent oxidoreductase n=1 Tax=Aromatoleum petrolei TaxID=76116 RepID=A0ABX1MKZ6_9RHOO|nr:SDR family NAD(P)-dependent oxidoreductase [Aromatoleum petrolei]NMF88639.1 SDR family NAD(P)-dependent oxidoreductase [Aromatoleum petrolei]QTQ34648.1 Putative short-chain type dehydrogenase/reductase [Aromatoleum petrolei]
MGNMVKDKVVVITGSGAGIGRDFALAFAASGAKVVVNDVGRARDSDEFLANQVVDEIRAAGGEAIAATQSIATWDSAHEIIQKAIDAYGRIDCVVNNAGIVRDRFFFKMSEEEWKAVIDVHLNGSFYMSRAAAPHFKEQNGGSIVHMTSTSGLIGNFGQSNYSAAKMAIVGLSKSIALDMAKFNVRSNCIAPWAWTAMTATIPEDTPENKARVAKMKKMEAGKIAPLAVYLASDAAAHVSGQIFGVRANEIYFFNQIRMIRSLHRDGGWTPETIAEHAMPAFESSFFPNVPSLTLTPWDPI